MKHVFQNLNEAADHLINHPFFKKFVAKPSTETYVNRLCEALESVCIGSPAKLPSAKRRLSEILDRETIADETGSKTQRTARSITKCRVMCHTESEDSLASTSQIASSSNKNKHKHKKTKKH